MYQFILPDVGEGTHESEIIKWFFKEGDTVKEDEALVEIQSDKAMVELPSPVTGVIRKLHVAENDMALVGKPIADIEVEGQGTVKTTNVEAPVSSVKDQPQNTLHSKEESSLNLAEIRKMAVPRVRMYARNHSVDLTQVKGTGSHGKITIEDIDAYLANGSSVVPNEVVQPEATTVQKEVAVAPMAKVKVETTELDRIEKLSSMRKVIAKAMVQSKQTSPHVTVFDQVEVSALVAHRNDLKQLAAAKGIKLTYTAYFVKAIVAMLKRFPELNASINLDKGEIYYHQYISVGVATNTENGLYVPVIRNTDRLSLFEIAEKVTQLSEQSNEGQLKPSDMGHGSLTLTNVGGIATGGVWSTPIINQPEVAILGVGRIEEIFLPDENRQPILKPVLKLSFAFDHRVVDGVTAQKAINLVKEYLNNPNLLLSEG